MALSETPYFLPTAEKPSCIISLTSCLGSGRLTTLRFFVAQEKHNPCGEELMGCPHSLQCVGNERCFLIG